MRGIEDTSFRGKLPFNGLYSLDKAHMIYAVILSVG